LSEVKQLATNRFSTEDETAMVSHAGFDFGCAVGDPQGAAFVLFKSAMQGSSATGD
jgi:hypothetical protein